MSGPDISYITKTNEKVKEAEVIENDANEPKKSSFSPAVSALTVALAHLQALLSVVPFSMPGRITVERQPTQIPFHSFLLRYLGETTDEQRSCRVCTYNLTARWSLEVFTPEKGNYTSVQMEASPAMPVSVSASFRQSFSVKVQLSSREQ